MTSQVRARAARLLRRGTELRRRDPFVSSLGEAYARDWMGCRAVFALSTGRSGTRTLAAVLGLAPEVCAHHEPLPRLVRASYERYMDGHGAERWEHVVRAARDEFVYEAARRGQVYAETNNRLTFFADTLAAIYPASVFIHLHRAPEEVVASGLSRGYYAGHNWDFARIRPRPGDPAGEAWPRLSAAEKIAWYWSAVNSFAVEFLATLPPERRFSLPARALFGGDPGTLADLFAFVGVPAPRRREVHSVLRRRLNTLGRRPALRPAERATVAAATAGAAHLLGYAGAGPGE